MVSKWKMPFYFSFLWINFLRTKFVLLQVSFSFVENSSPCFRQRILKLNSVLTVICCFGKSVPHPQESAQNLSSKSSNTCNWAWGNFRANLIIFWICSYFQGSQTCFTKFHPIKKDVYYRLWNLASNGLIQKDPNNPAIVPCSGGFSGPDISKNILKYSLTNTV